MISAVVRAVRPRIGAPRWAGIAEIVGSIVGTQLVTSAFGVVFWAVAARGLTPSTVGRLGAATSAIMLLGAFGALGAGTLLISRLGRTAVGQRRELFVAGVAAAFAGGAVLAAGFGAAASAIVPAFGFLSPSHATFWWLVAASAATAAGGVFDQAMLVVGRPRMQVVRNAMASVLKVVVFVVAVAATLGGVTWGMFAWTLGQTVAAGLALLTVWRALPAEGPVTARGLWAAASRHSREALHHHGINLALGAPMMLQPVIVSAVVSAERNAVYTTVRLITMFGFMIPYALAMALFAASSVTPAIEDRDVSLAQRAQAVFRLSLVLSLGIYAGLFALAPLLLGVFGSGYATGGGGYLRIAGLACPLLVFKDQYIARCRARQDIGGLLPFALTMTIAEIAATLAGALAGDLRGALLGWIAALTLGAIWVSSIRSGARQAAPTPRRSADSAGQVAVPGTLQGADPLRATDGSIGESSVSVVVCTYDIGRFDQLIRCLGSIATQSVTPIEVVVVVDGSAEIAAALRRRVGPETVVVLERNLGMSAARNAGAARVRSTWVAFLDDDAVADPHWLDNLLECARRTGAAGVGGRSDPVFDPAEPRWLPPELLWTVGCSYRGMPTRSTVQRNTFGGCAVLRTDVFGLVGGYNVKLGRRGSGVQGGEEADLCLRIRAADPQAFFFYEPDAVIRHRVGASRLTRRYVLRRCLSDGRTKSTIARSSGRRALSTERTYLVRTALVGVLRAAATLRLQRAAVLVAGVGCAAAGYLIGRIGPAEPPAGLHSAKGLPVK